MYIPQIPDIEKAAEALKGIVVNTPLQESLTYSRLLQANVYLKREDLQPIRSYKIRGAYNKMLNLSEPEKQKGVICASAGNHAQGVAFSCERLKIHGIIYMPSTTPKQKVEQVEMFGQSYVTIVLSGDTFDDAYNAALLECKRLGMIFVHPFDDKKIIEGQATVALELVKQASAPLDYLIAPVGGGGLISGILSVFKQFSPNTKIIGVEPEGAPSMSISLKNGQNTRLDTVDTFVDGAAVRQVGVLNFELSKQFLDKMITVPEGKVCKSILDLYTKDAIVVEPAGALSVAALTEVASEIRGKRVACIVSGGNNDITRMAEIQERALLYEGLKHYFIMKFPQRAGVLKDFVTRVLGPTDDITYFEYQKKHSKENGPAIIGIELKHKEDLAPLLTRMKEHNFYGEYINDKLYLFDILI